MSKPNTNIIRCTYCGNYKYIKKNKLYNNADILAYLYGSINHYSCDTTMHPYINYLSTIAKNKISMHTKIEFEIDAYYYEKYNNCKCISLLW